MFMYCPSKISAAQALKDDSITFANSYHTKGLGASDSALIYGIYVLVPSANLILISVPVNL